MHRDPPALRSSSARLCFHVPARQGTLELVQQCAGRPQIRQVEPLGEPSKYGRERRQGFRVPALFAPQTAQARRGAQLPHFRVLLLREGDRPLQMRLRFGGRRWAVMDDPLAHQPMQLGCEPLLAGFLGDRERRLELVPGFAGSSAAARGSKPATAAIV